MSAMLQSIFDLPGLKYQWLECEIAHFLKNGIPWQCGIGVSLVPSGLGL